MIRGQTGRIACPDSRAAGSGRTEPGTPSMTAPRPSGFGHQLPSECLPLIAKPTAGSTNRA
jgi:hypothetical protein